MTSETLVSGLGPVIFMNRKSKLRGFYCYLIIFHAFIHCRMSGLAQQTSSKVLQLITFNSLTLLDVRRTRKKKAESQMFSLLLLTSDIMLLFPDL